MPFAPPPEDPKEEELRILEAWDREDLMGRIRSRRRKYVFLEGPPSANGPPHMGHARTRIVKDSVLRYWIMRGYAIFPWIGGWDCHGLPIEVEVERELGVRNKREVLERFGIEEFNRRSREAVFRYKRLWEEFTRRIGFWLDLDNAYITMENYYIESVWWALKEIWKKGLLEKHYKVVPYCPRCGTPLSSHEVAQGYEEVEDPSLVIRLRELGSENHFLVWTTTPWTLPSNVLLAVHPDLDYLLVEKDGFRYYIAEARAGEVLGGEFRVLKRLRGRDLVGKRYEPPFPYLRPRKGHYVVAADFVSSEEGTGIVHIAPAFGEDDFELGKREGVDFFKPVDEEGRFTDEVPPVAGTFFKDADKVLIEILEEEGKIYSLGTYRHNYPFCWRCGTPLMYYAIDTWYIRTSKLRDLFMELNSRVNWVPGHVREGRFGSFLRELKDWALSRNRFWGTPLPVWVCEEGHVHVVGSVEELRSMALDPVPEDLDLHRPWVDRIRLRCPVCGKPMLREPYTIDVWFDSGAATFAQFHYPFENEEEFREAYPVDFISEGIDQTRGWFYSLLAVNGMLFEREPYRNVLVIGLVLDEKGEKMSKSKGNVVDPVPLLEEVGADPLRLYMLSTPAWRDLRFSTRGIEELRRRVLDTLWNVYKFFSNNANLDGFEPDGGEPGENPLDRWILSRLSWLSSEFNRGFESLSIHRGPAALPQFVDDLSNWYLRLSRRRFWREGMDEDKLSAYRTLYRVLVQLARLLAPVTPFTAEMLHRRLTGESVFLSEYPQPGPRDEELESQFAEMKAVVEAGRRARQRAGIKARIPLLEAIVVGARLPEELAELARMELNVKDLRFGDEGPRVRRVKLNLSRAAPRLRGRTPEAARLVEELGEGALAMAERGELEVGGVRLGPEDLLVEEEVDPEYVREEAEGVEVYLRRTLTRELRLEGLARDIVRRIQVMRKELDLEYDRRIRTWVLGDEEVSEALRMHGDYIAGETLSVELREAPGRGYHRVWEVDGKRVEIWIEPT